MNTLVNHNTSERYLYLKKKATIMMKELIEKMDLFFKKIFPARQSDDLIKYK